MTPKSFKTEDTGTRTIYADSERWERHFVALNGMKGLKLSTEGANRGKPVHFFDTLARLSPLGILEFTATPDTSKARGSIPPIIPWRVATSALCTGFPVREVMELISETSRLYRLGLLVSNQCNYTEFKFADLVARAFLGTTPLLLHSPYTTTPTELPYLLISFGIYEKNLLILQGLLTQDRLVNVLLYGVPGTDKSELANAIAQAFHEAEAADGILLLDEADSLFLNRTQAQRSWERSQTNELLIQREAYSGVFVCCMNFLGALSPASPRCFTFKVGFKPLSEEGRLTLFGRYFSEVELTIEAAERLVRLDTLTPGDFKAARTRMRFGPVVNAETLVSAFVEECRYREQGRRIGFSR